jgi:hypothetical protein
MSSLEGIMGTGEEEVEARPDISVCSVQVLALKTAGRRVAFIRVAVVLNVLYCVDNRYRRDVH